MEEDERQFDRMRRSIMGPAWRWKQARELAAYPHSYLKGDQHILEAAAYLQLGAARSAHATVGQKYELLEAALGLWRKPEACGNLKVMVLGGCSQSEISERLGVSTQVIEKTELLLFDVRPLLDARGWLVSRVILPESDRGAYGLAVKMNAALLGGPVMARRLIETPDRIPLSEAEKLLDEELLLHLKLQEALKVSFTIDLCIVNAPVKGVPPGNRASPWIIGYARVNRPQESLRFMKMFFDYDYRTKRLRLAEQRFHHHCDQEMCARERAEQRQEFRLRKKADRKATEEARTARTTEKARTRQERDLAQARLHYQQNLAEQQAAEQRAASSLLGRLKWTARTEDTAPDLLTDELPRASDSSVHHVSLPMLTPEEKVLATA